MHYGDLKEIIKHLKKTMPCTSCSKKFADMGIRVLSTFENEALFHFGCIHCKNQLMVHVSIVEKNNQMSKLNIQAHTPGQITPNDVLDMHIYLTNFNGDFKELFSA